jgi:hypothetical protein
MEIVMVLSYAFLNIMQETQVFRIQLKPVLAFVE